MRWIGAVVIGAVLLVGVGGVALAHLRSGTAAVVAGNAKPSTCADAYRVLALRPSQIAAAKPVCLVQSLKFSGELTGTAAEAYPVSADDPSPTSMCSVPKRWDGFPEARLALVVGAKAYRLRILAPGASQHHPETFNNLANLVELRAIKDPSSDWNQATGTLTMNADGITGTIDANLLRDIAGAQPVHVTGKWACGAPLPLPAFDASVPCARFYALNQIHDEDVARMKAGACQAEDLTFSGAIQAHLDHAITDTAVPVGVAYAFDDVCGLGGYKGEDYAAALKFSIGDESFLINIRVRALYAVVGPGQYALGTDSGIAPGINLFWGRADPDNQGRFETSVNTSWFSSGGTFTIAPDMKSGTVDASLTGFLAPAGSDVQIKGNWRCGS